MANPEISKITLPSGTTYDIKDATARAKIDSLSGAVTYLGVTTTALTDGSTTATVSIGGKQVTAAAGDVVIYGELEFIWSDTEKKWHEFGSTGSLKALAFKDSASASYTPAGTVSAPTFTGKAVDVTLKTTAAGSVTISKGTVSTDSPANYTPEGAVSTPTITVTPTTASVKPFGSAGTLPSCTLPNMTATVADETLTLGWTAGSFSAGTLPTAGTAVTVATGIKSATSSKPTFTGTGVKLDAAFTGKEADATGSVTASGTVGTPTFKGTAATITAK